VHSALLPTQVPVAQPLRSHDPVVQPQLPVAPAAPPPVPPVLPLDPPVPLPPVPALVPPVPEPELPPVPPLPPVPALVPLDPPVPVPVLSSLPQPTEAATATALANAAISNVRALPVSCMALSSDAGGYKYFTERWLSEKSEATRLMYLSEAGAACGPSADGSC